MQEIIIQLEHINPIEFFGVQNKMLNHFKSFFPKVKVSDRGNELHVKGDEDELKAFEENLRYCIKYFEQYGKLTLADIEKIIVSEDKNILIAPIDDVVLYGMAGAKIKPKTPNQRALVKAVKQNDMVFATGAAGTGKTYISVAMAVRALKNKEVKRIIITRPAVEAGENLGFLPGDLKDKLDPYLQPLYDALRDMIPPEKLEYYMEAGIVQIAPLAYMRGRTLDKAFVILDEGQNATTEQMKMFLTRMGKEAKFIITGDPSQVDLHHRVPSGMIQALKYLKDIKGIAQIKFDSRDVVRHALVKSIIEAYDSQKEKEEK